MIPIFVMPDSPTMGVRRTFVLSGGLLVCVVHVCVPP
jgi:hypothetical protein